MEVHPKLIFLETQKLQHFSCADITQKLTQRLYPVASSFTSLSQRPYTPLGHKQFNVSSSDILKNRAKRVVSFQAANRRAQKLFLLTSPPKPADYGLTRITQPNLSEQVFFSCPLRDVTHTRQLIIRVGTCILVTFLPRYRHCCSINQR